MAPLQDMWYIEIKLHLTYDSLGRDSSTFSSTSSFSRSNTTFDTGLFMVLFLAAWSTLLPIFNLTLRTNPLSSQYVCITLHICRSFLMVFTFLQDHNISNLQVPFSVCAFFPFLKWLQEFLPSATPEFIHCVLNPRPSSVAV